MKPPHSDLNRQNQARRNPSGSYESIDDARFVPGTIIVLLALAVYGYYILLGGQSPFNVKLLAED